MCITILQEATGHDYWAWNKQMGYGRINVYNAVQLANAVIGQPVRDIGNVTYNIDNTSSQQLQLLGGGCSSLPFGAYSVRRYAVTKSIAYSYISNPAIITTSSGISAANPNTAKRWATAENITNTTATLKTYAYQVYSTSGASLGWFPTTPSNIKFDYILISGPDTTIFETNRTNNTSASLKPSKLQLEWDDEESNYKSDLITSPESSLSSIKLINKSSSVEAISLLDGKITDLVVYDQNGRLVKSLQNQLSVKGGSVYIEISGLPQGIYYLQYNFKGKIAHNKFVKL